MQVVFAAGFLVPQTLLGIEYFRETREAFPDALFPDVDPTASIDQRASTLAATIDAAFRTGPIHVIAHSMAGLDTRRVLSQNLRGLADRGRIVALSTISTPHRGSPIADLLIGPKPNLLDIRFFHYR